MSSGNLFDAFKDSFDTLLKEFTSNKNSRYLSWEYCYKEFLGAFSKLSTLTPDDYLHLALHLAFYLASWGMYRGSSFLLQFDYKIHIETVKLILRNDYSPLLGYYWEKGGKDYSANLNLLFGDKGLVKSIKEIYRPFREKVERNGQTEQDISTILVTKILLGTLGCVPAYDQMLKRALKFGKEKCGEKSLIQRFGKNSFEALIDFYSGKKPELEKRRKNLALKDFPSIEYPQMKFLDMGLWQLGLEKLREDNKKKKEKEELEKQAKQASL